VSVTFRANTGILLVSLFVFLILGIAIACSLGLSGFFYFVFVHPELLSILPQRFLAGMDSYAMIALPLFILMGLLMNAGGITTRLIDFSMLFVCRFRGGPGAVNVFASMVFGGISGSSVSDTASVGAVLIPEAFSGEPYPRHHDRCSHARDNAGHLLLETIPKEEINFNGKGVLDRTKKSILALIMPIFVVGAVFPYMA
jgi:hypothetical protein